MSTTGVSSVTFATWSDSPDTLTIAPTTANKGNEVSEYELTVTWDPTYGTTPAAYSAIYPLLVGCRHTSFTQANTINNVQYTIGNPTATTVDLSALTFTGDNGCKHPYTYTLEFDTSDGSSAYYTDPGTKVIEIKSTDRTLEDSTVTFTVKATVTVADNGDGQ